MNAVQLLEEHLHRLAEAPETWLELFSEDVLIEFPFASALGTPSQLNGKNEFRSYLKTIPEMKWFKFSNPRFHSFDNPDVACLEIDGRAEIPSTGRIYQLSYVMFARVRAGKIINYREYWDPSQVLEAIQLEGAKS